MKKPLKEAFAGQKLTNGLLARLAICRNISRKVAFGPDVATAREDLLAFMIADQQIERTTTTKVESHFAHLQMHKLGKKYGRIFYCAWQGCPYTK